MRNVQNRRRRACPPKVAFIVTDAPTAVLRIQSRDDMTYSEKLKDPRWQKLRLEVFQRDNFTCLACGSKDKTLCVHHLEYNGRPWEADMAMLETLCNDCHTLRGEWDKALSSMPSRKALMLQQMVLQILRNCQHAGIPAPKNIILAALRLFADAIISLRVYGIGITKEGQSNEN